MNSNRLKDAPRFTRPLNLHRELRRDITRPFQETPRRPAAHDMLLLNLHADLLAAVEPVAARDLAFFNCDFP